MLTCTGVSFAHGSNDGQKGMGLIMLILVGIVPAAYALNLGASADTLRRLSEASSGFSRSLAELSPATAGDAGAARQQLTQYLRTQAGGDDAAGARDAERARRDPARRRE